MSEAPSPLLSVPEDTLTILFTSDPLSLSDAQLDALILELRRRRSEFAASEATKALAPKKTRTAKDPSTPEKALTLDKPIGEVSLDDIL